MQRDIRADLTGKPRLEAGRELKKLADMLTRIHEPEAAVKRGEALNAWHERWKTLLAERTYAKEHPDDSRAAASTGGWWWTHLPLRRAYFRLERLFKDGTIFRFLDPELTILGPVPRGSNRLEGGLNAAPDRMLVKHRGLPEAHMRRACEWHCTMHSAKPHPFRIIKQHDQGAKTDTNHDDEPMSQQAPGTGIDWNEFHTNTRYPDATDWESKSTTLVPICQKTSSAYRQVLYYPVELIPCRYRCQRYTVHWQSASAPRHQYVICRIG